MNQEEVYVFTAQQAAVKTAPFKKQRGDIGLFISGPFDGATVALEVSPDVLTEDPEDMTWFRHPSATFTYAGLTDQRIYQNADLAVTYMRGVLENPGAGTEVTFKVRTRSE